MIWSVATVLGIVTTANVFTAWLEFPAPGAVVALVVLTSVFILRRKADAGLSSLYDRSAPHFSLLFVPAATGLMASGDVLAQIWVYVAVAITLGTAVTIAATGLLIQLLLLANAGPASHE